AVPYYLHDRESGAADAICGSIPPPTGRRESLCVGRYGRRLPRRHLRELCAYCCVKNVEASWSLGTDIGFYSTFRSVLRNSFIHETPLPNPGGSGYLSGLNVGASDNLLENNIIWYGNKEIVMRATGGGNVVAYNYMGDSFGCTYPESSE